MQERERQRRERRVEKESVCVLKGAFGCC
jgi:hypothetical protein